MSKLTKLYGLMNNAQDLGIDLGEDLYKQIDKLEEELIKKEILPIIQDKIEPTLSQIKRNLTLIVDYVPDVSVRVRLSRDEGIFNNQSIVDFVPDPKVEHTTWSINKKYKKARASAIKIIRRDNTVLMKSSAAQTLAEAIKEADPIKVRKLGIICCKIPLVSNALDDKYAPTQVEVSPGLYVITHSNNKTKKAFLDKISKALNLGWRVEIIR